MKFCKKRNYPRPLWRTMWNIKSFPNSELYFNKCKTLHTNQHNTAQRVCDMPNSGISKQLKGNLLTYDKFPQTAAAAWPGGFSTISLSYNLMTELSYLPVLPAGTIHYFVVSCCLSTASVVTC